MPFIANNVEFEFVEILSIPVISSEHPEVSAAIQASTKTLGLLFRGHTVHCDSLSVVRTVITPCCLGIWKLSACRLGFQS